MPCKVVVQFSPQVARLVTETRRHPTQAVKELRDGSVLWEVTVTDLREIKWWLVALGGEVKVLEHQPLASDIQEAARTILKRYKQTDKSCQ